ncbi:MAG: hypothetical protein ACREFW_03340 [Rhizomicrobium sp.]
MRAMVPVLVAGLLPLAPIATLGEDITCNNGIVGVALHLDSVQGTIVMEGVTYHVKLTDPKIAFSTIDLAGDKIDYLLDRSRSRLTETDHDRLPDGSFKTISLAFDCSKSGG